MRKGEGFGQYDGDHEGNHPPYPGVIIEEMIDSASQIGSPDDAKAMSKVKDPEVSLLYNVRKLLSCGSLIIFFSNFVLNPLLRTMYQSLKYPSFSEKMMNQSM